MPQELAPFHSPASYTSIATTSWKTRRAGSTVSHQGREVRLRYGYFIKCEEVDQGRLQATIVELRCTYDPETRGGSAPDGTTSAGQHFIGFPQRTLSTPRSRLYDSLFTVRQPKRCPPKDKDLELTSLIPDSLTILNGCKLEPSLSQTSDGRRDIPVRARRLLHQGQGLHSRNARLQPRPFPSRDTWARIQNARRVSTASGIA